MGKFLIVLLALAFLAALNGSGSRPGQHPEKPQRIVSLAPAITETLQALDLGENLAGVTRFCRIAPGAAPVPEVGGFREVSLEAIARTNADLLILPHDMAHFRSMIEALGIPVLLFSYASLPDYLASVRTLGRISGREEQAERLVSEFNAAFAAQAPQAAPTVLFVLLNPDEFDSQPAEMTIVGSDEFYNGVIAAAGGRNAYAGPVPFPRISLEAMLGLKPDVIVLAAPRHTDENRLLASWRNAPGLKQAKASQFLLLCDPADTIPGPSALATIQKLAQAIRSVRESG